MILEKPQQITSFLCVEISVDHSVARGRARGYGDWHEIIDKFTVRLNATQINTQPPSASIHEIVVVRGYCGVQDLYLPCIVSVQFSESFLLCLCQCVGLDPGNMHVWDVSIYSFFPL